MASMLAERGHGRNPADDVLDRTAEIARAKMRAHAASQDDPETDGETPVEAPPVQTSRLAHIIGWVPRAWQFFITQSFSSLTRRIVFLNVAGLLALSIGINFLSEFRAGLIDARVQSLLVQGQIIAGAIAASATVETNSSLTIDPDKLLELHPGESYGPSEEALYGIDFPINPERVAPVLRRLVSPTKTRARIYDRDGVLLVDSRNLFGRGDVLRFDLPPPNAEKPGLFERAFIAVAALARARRSSALSRARRPERPRLSRSGAGLERPECQHGAHQRAWRCHRLGRSAGAALPRGARRAHALDPRRRHRRHGRGRAACHSQGLPRRHRGDGRAFDPAWPARSPSRCGGLPTLPKACAGASDRGSKFRISPAGATRSGTCPARCAT